MKSGINKETVNQYLKTTLRQHAMSSQADNVNIVVVVPTYNEELTIKNLLLSLNHQRYINFEVVIVDNGSTDRTKVVVESMRKDVFYYVCLLDEPKPGPGNARKLGMDEAVYRFYHRSNFSLYQNYIITTTDADAKLPEDWLETINQELSRQSCGALSGTHLAEAKINKLIFDKLGLEDYFNKAHQLVTLLAERHTGKVKMRGPNSAVSLEAYCAAGGIEQPYIGSRVGTREMSYLQDKIVRHGYRVSHLYKPVITSQRRHLFEVINGGKVGQYLTEKDHQERFTTVRESEEELLYEAITFVPKERWIKYQKEVLKIVCNQLIFEPLVRHEIKPESLKDILDENSVEVIIRELGSGLTADLMNEAYSHKIISNLIGYN